MQLNKIEVGADWHKASLKCSIPAILIQRCFVNFIAPSVMNSKRIYLLKLKVFNSEHII